MITLRADCLIFKLASGEQVPLSPEMLVGELSEEKGGRYDPEVLQHAASAVFHYFKNDLGLETVTIGEFAEAFEKILHGLRLEKPTRATAGAANVFEADLRRMALESGEVNELFFFPMLRRELRRQLDQTPDMLRLIGLRECVKELTGARRWTPRCQHLHDRIVNFIRVCLQTDAHGKHCGVVVR